MKRLPVAAIALGVGGLVPFLALSVAVLVFPADVPVPRLIAALEDYGAVILSFLGAVHWGLTLGEGWGGAWTRLSLSVLPALVAWAALLVGLTAPAPVALLILLAGFVGTLVVERRAAARGHMPPGYLALRYLLTAVVVVCLGAVAVARAVF